MDNRGILLISGVLTLLGCATAVIAYLQHKSTGLDSGVLSSCRSRLYAWWLLFISLICSVLLGTVATVILFGFISFWALREYVTLTPTRPADHRTLVGVFFLLTPLQFMLVGVDSDWFTRIFHLEPYLVFSILIPTLSVLILPATVAISGDPKFFLERIAKLQVGLLICVYALSFAPALMTMKLPASNVNVSAIEVAAVDLEDKALKPLEEAAAAYNAAKEATTVEELSATVYDVANAPNTSVEGESVESTSAPSAKKVISPHKRMSSSNMTLLFFFVFLTQISDIAQFCWSQVFKKHKIAPKVNSSKTTEGVLLGIMTTVLLAFAMKWFSPFENWLQAAFAGLLISVMGFAGNMTISAIKRDQGVGEYGELVEGHSGVLDRIDSLCFAAPVFFQYVRLCLN